MANKFDDPSLEEVQRHLDMTDILSTAFYGGNVLLELKLERDRTHYTKNNSSIFGCYAYKMHRYLGENLSGLLSTIAPLLG